jgi:Ca-activated chloride channel family protein
MKRLLPALLLLATARLAASQDPAAESPIVVDEVIELGLQQLYVTVTDRRGARVVDLGPETFSVLDDDRPQEIVTFEGGDIPITAVLVVDGSQSMAGAPLRAARSGVEAFALEMRDLDEASVLVFSDRLLSRTPFASAADEVLAGLDALEATGGSAVHDHLYLALKVLEERQGRRVVLLLSDGLDGHSVVSFDQLDHVARVSRSLVYWVRTRQRHRMGADTLTLGTWVGPRQLERDHRRLKKLVRRSGGRIVEIDRVSDVEWAFREVLSELREQYAIGYYPSPPHTGSGRFRTVRVKVERPGLRVRTREGYIDR